MTDKERIEKDAKEYCHGSPHYLFEHRAYIAGATQENEHLREQLKQERNEAIRVASLILKVRDALVIRDYDEAYHRLYEIASPDFSKIDPWKELETLTAHGEQ